MPTTLIPVDAVIVDPDRAKRRKLRDIEDLAASIRELGVMLNPITVNHNMVLIAGWHRLEAAKHLGWSEIEAKIVEMSDVDAVLAEIDENLMRHDLDHLAEAEELARRKTAYETKHPETKHGGTGRNRVAKNATLSFVADTAKKTNQTPRTVYNTVRIATKIDASVRNQLRDTDTADSKTDLLELAKLTTETQRVVADRIVEGQAASVRDAVKTLKAEAKAESDALLSSGEVDRLRFRERFAKSRRGLTDVLAFDAVRVAETHNDQEIAILRDTLRSVDAWLTRIEQAATQRLRRVG